MSAFFKGTASQHSGTGFGFHQNREGKSAVTGSGVRIVVSALPLAATGHVRPKTPPRHRQAATGLPG